MSETGRLLVIDDEIHIVTILKRRFESAGWIVVLARDGREGVAAAKEHLPDAIIVDYQMPHMNGAEVVEALASDPATASIPVLMLTARAHLVEDGAMAGSNVRDVLSKPFSARELMTRVQAMVATDGGEGVVGEAA